MGIDQTQPTPFLDVLLDQRAHKPAFARTIRTHDMHVPFARIQRSNNRRGLYFLIQPVDHIICDLANDQIEFRELSFWTCYTVHVGLRRGGAGA